MGADALLLAGWLFLTAFVAYLFLENLGFLAMIVLVGGAGAVLLSYPILITLERPVRMTPEQALRDYYGALSHQSPHFRRMWLLLGKDGQDEHRLMGRSRGSSLTGRRSFRSSKGARPAR